MTDILQIGLENRDYIAGGEQIIAMNNRMIKSADDLHQAAGTSLPQAGGEFTKYKKTAVNALEEVSRAVRLANSNAVAAEGGGVQYQLGLMAKLAQARQQDYETRVAAATQLGRDLEVSEIKQFREQGVRLDSVHRLRLARAAKEARELQSETDKWNAAADAHEAGRAQREMQEGNKALQARLQAMEAASKAEDAYRRTRAAASLEQGGYGVIAAKQEAEAALKVKKAAAEVEDALMRDRASKQAMYERLFVESDMRAEKAVQAAAMQTHKTKIELLNAQITKARQVHEAEVASAVKAAAMLDKAQWSVIKASNKPSGSYTEFNAKTGAMGATIDMDLPAKLKATKVAADELDGGFKKLQISGNDLHSLSRGLASGFGLLWLTWGNMIPLLAGAAVSNGFMQTAKQGMEVAHTMETIGALGGATNQELGNLNGELIRLGRTGPFGPREVAEAMKTLSLAGLQANEILSVTPDVLNFAVAGTTDIKTAADSLVSISTAFGMGADGFARVGDVIAKTASVSKSSVESIGEAMKTASVINKQYGVSLEDTGVALAAMSQLGIEGSAAGTALRNMYADLSGRSVQVAKILKAQGIEMRTATGEFRPLIEVVDQLNTKFNAMSGISRQNLMQALLSERGAKGIIEMLDLIQTKSSAAGGEFANALQESIGKITDSYGFAAIQAARLGSTVQSEFKAVSTNLQTSMQVAYQSIEPSLRLLADSFQRAFASPTFIAALSTTLDLIARLALVITDNVKLIALAAAGFTASRIALMALNATVGMSIGSVASAAAGWIGLTAAVNGNTAATTANATANAAAAASRVGMLGTLARALPVVGNLIALGSAAWMAWDFYRGKASDTAERADELYNKDYVKSLKDEADRIEKINNLRAQGLTLQEADMRMKEADARMKGRGSLDAAMTETAIAKIRMDAANGPSSAKDRFNQKTDLEKQQLREAYKEAKAKSDNLKASYDASMKEADDAIARIKEGRRWEADAERAELAARKDSIVSQYGGGKFELGAGAGAESAAAAELRRQQSAEKAAFDKAVSDHEASLRLKEDALSRSINRQYSLLQSQHSNELISEAAFQAQQLKNTLDGEQAATAIRTQAFAEYKELLWKRTVEVNETLTGESRTNALAELSRQYQLYVDKMNAADTKQVEAAADRMAKAWNNAEGEIVKLMKSADKFAAEDAVDIAKAGDIVTESLNKYDQAANTAAVNATAKWDKAMLDLELAAVKAAASVAELRVQFAGTDSPEGSKMLTQAQENLDRINKKLEEMKGKQAASVEAAKAAAVGKVKAEEKRKFGNDLADAIVTAMTKGGEEGSKALRTTLEEQFRTQPLKLEVQAFVSEVLGLGGKNGSGTADKIGSMFSSWFGGSSGSDVTFSGVLAKIGDGLYSMGAETIGSYLKDFVSNSGLSTFSEFAKNAASWYNGALNYVDAFNSASEGKWGSAIGTAVGAYFGGSVGSAIGKLLGGIVDRGFGGGGEYTTSTGLEGTFYGSSFSGQQYQTWYNPGSWWGQSSNGRNVYALDSTTQSSLGQAFGLSKVQTLQFAAALGAATPALNKVANYSQYVNIDGNGGATNYKAALENILASMGNTMAGFIISSKFQKSGETLSATLARLATSLTTVNGLFTIIDKSAFSLSEASAGVTAALIDAFDGVENFTSATKSYYDLFFTDAEKRADTVASLSATIGKFGIALPSSKQAFRDLVASTDVTTDAGRALYVTLMGMSSAFASLYDSANSANSAIKQLTENDFATLVDFQRWKYQNTAPAVVQPVVQPVVVAPPVVAPTPAAAPAAAPAASSGGYFSSSGGVSVGIFGSLFSGGSGLGTLMGYADGGTHGGGWRVVGEQGPELEYTNPSRIYNNAESLFDLSPLLAEVAALRAEVSNLRAETRAVVVNTGKQARTIDKWDNQGMPAEVV